ncbi:MAG TPA: hypothetical protein VKV03_11460 [Candidatus Binataceae bacterium]|nr:hypothetical protein [Candidatus Binataceae bacterium]
MDAHSMTKLFRVLAPVTIVTICAIAVAIVRAQQNLPPPGAYQPIPDFTGNLAGLAFRGAINDRLSGVQPITPRVTDQTFSSLPAEADGLLMFCKDCQQTIPCTNGGPGAWAFGQNGVWTCTAPNTAGNVLFRGESGAQLNDLGASLNGTFNLKSTPFSAHPDAQVVSDGAMTAGSPSLTSASAPFKVTDLGKAIIVGGAGASGGLLQTTIATFTSSTQISLASAASTTTSGAGVLWGTDNRAAIQSAITASGSETIAWAAPGNYLVTCPGSGNPAINLFTFGATLMGASGHGGTDIGQLPSVQILGSGCPLVQINANGVGLEGLAIRDPIGNSSTVGLQIGPPNNANALSTFTIARNSIVCQKSNGTKCYVGTGLSTHFALRGMISDNAIEDWGTGISLGSGNTPGLSESNAIVLIADKIRENVTGLLVPSGAVPDVFSFGNTIEGNLYGVDLEGNAIFKDFGSHFENGNPNIPVTAPAVCGGATPAPVEIVNCASNVEALSTGFYGLVGGNPITTYYGTSNLSSKLEGGPVSGIINGAGQLVLQDITAGPSSTAGIGSNVGVVVLESGTQTTMLQGGSVYQFRGFPYLDFTSQDSRFRTVIAALGGNDPNNGTLCFGLNCAHYLAEQGANHISASDAIYANFAPQFAGEVNVEGQCLGCATPAEVTATQLQAQTSVLQGGGWKHQNVSTGSIASSGAADVTLTWTVAFADAGYDPICEVIGSQASNSDLRLHHIESISSTTVVARVVNDDSSSAHTGTLVCTAMHQ